MTWEKDPYRILGISHSATTEDIKVAYRKLAHRLHPDVNPGSAAAALQFQDVTSAHELLTSPTRRSEYDQRFEKSDPDDEFHFTLQVTPSKRKVMPLAEPQIVYVLTEIMPDERAGERKKGQEARLNLTLVLDQSNSMSGSRIEKVKIAAHQIIDNLTENDFISVITFNDRAETIIRATPVKDKASLKARISLIGASGGTEIFQGLNAGVQETRQYLGPKLINHIILLTDGHTFGDQKQCLDLAQQAAREGIGISAMGLGHDWNDEFLDDIASRTGGSSEYIKSASAVVKFLNDQVRSLANAFADRVMLSVAVDPDVVFESAFKLAPNPQPLAVNGGNLPLGTLQINRPISVLLQLQLPSEMSLGTRTVARVTVNGDILLNSSSEYQELQDFSIDVTSDQVREDPPTAILDALSKLTLYRLQERAREALEKGNADEATRRLENLATRLLAMGQDELANQALIEARRVAHTNDLSDRGRKTLKYQTRHLLLSDSDKDEML
ncbi:MAG: VWA domain-containing protein [Chloroflexota bacterium]